MGKSRATYPRNSTFAKRIRGQESQKEAVAQRVVDEYLGDGQSAFVSDGSSTFFIGLSLFAARREHFTLYTNSLPIAHEYPLWKTSKWPRDFSMYLAGGEVNRDLMMPGGAATCDEIERHMARMAHWTIVSVRAIFGDRGPAGFEWGSLLIKEVALRSARRIILLADDAKLSQRYENRSPRLPLLYAVRSDWQNLLKRETTYVITTLPRKTTSGEMWKLYDKKFRTGKTPDPATARERYAINTWPLRESLGSNFVEIAHPDDTAVA